MQPDQPTQPQESDLLAEVDRLRNERLHLLREVDRAVALGDLMLRCSTEESPGEVVRRAEELLRRTLMVGEVRSVGLTEESADADSYARQRAPRRAPRKLPTELAEWLSELPTAALINLSDHGGPDLSPLLAFLYPASELDGATVAFLPLRPMPGPPVGLIVLLALDGKPAPTDADATFLVMMTNHVGRALQNALQVSDLRAHGEELADSTRRYKDNVEDLQRTQRELLQARKLEAIGRLAGGIAHDFNNLLTVIRNHAEFLREALPDTAQAEIEDVDAISEAADRATRITRQLLAFGRRSEGRPELLDMTRVITDFTRLIGRLVGEHVSIDLKLDTGSMPIRADRAQVEQVLLNLLTNARDAMPDGGTVLVETRPAQADELEASGLPGEGRYLALLVSDTGRGMDEDTRAKLFEPFFTTKEPGHGTGLGLATVYGIVDSHGGRISVSSAPSQGTAFCIYLPIARSQSQEIEAVPVVPKSRVASVGKTVLLVEDDAALRSVAFRTLSSRGYRVIQARDGAEALEIAAQHSDRIDVVVTDVVMPRMSGPKLVAELRQVRPNVKVVYVSGYTFDMLDLRSLEDGAFLSKPFSSNDLVSAVRDAADPI